MTFNEAALLGPEPLEWLIRELCAASGLPQPDDPCVRRSKHADWTVYLPAWTLNGRPYWSRPTDG